MAARKQTVRKVLALTVFVAALLSATGCGYLKNVRDDVMDLGELSIGVNLPRMGSEATATLTDRRVVVVSLLSCLTVVSTSGRRLSVPTPRPARIWPSSIMLATPTMPFSRPRHAFETSQSWQSGRRPCVLPAQGNALGTCDRRCSCFGPTGQLFTRARGEPLVRWTDRHVRG